MKSFEIRKKFLDFFAKKEHKILPGSPLVLIDDPSLLFVNAGMNQFKDVFLGHKKAPFLNVVTIQKCMRAGGKHNDLETVGISPCHHTFFEMMGNFSFGGYFKEEAIKLSWQFLTEELGLLPEDLWVSIYEKDEESYKIWRDQQKLSENKIYLFGEKDNFWQMGETGPCGPCSEIYYYRGKESRPDPEQLMEIWNLVFMEFNKREDKTLEKLPHPSVDTGMGLERISSVLQNKKSNYHTDLFEKLISTLEKFCDFKYDWKESENTIQQKAFRVLADHARATAFLLSEGVRPGSLKENYVLRRIMRRALYYSGKLQPRANLLLEGAKKTIELMSSFYPELEEEKEQICLFIEKETGSFSESLKEGKKRLEEEMKTLKGKFISVETAWNLYSTYGFPMDLTRLIAEEKGWKMASEKELEQYTEKISKQKKEFSKAPEHSKISLDLKPTTKTYHQKDGTYKGKDLGKVLARARESDLDFLIFNQTCFYPEGGGPVGDIGFLKTKTGQAQVLDCQNKKDIVFHQIEIREGEMKENQECEMEVHKIFRKEISGSHTATHLLNAALRRVLGDKVRQAGSLVEPGRLRFDFTHPQPLSKKELKEVAAFVLRSIEKGEKLSSSYKSLEEAKTEGALFLPGDKYTQDKVRVLRIGEKSSLELCGGVHVSNTKEIGKFFIVYERGVQSGVRRIMAYTGRMAQTFEDYLIKENLDLRSDLKISPPKEDFIEKQNPFLSWQESQKKEVRSLRKSLIHLEDKFKEESLSPPQWIKVEKGLHPLARQNLELRESLPLPFPKEKEIGDIKRAFLNGGDNNPNFLDFFEEEGDSLKSWAQKLGEDLKSLHQEFQEIQKKGLTKDQLLNEAQSFTYQGIEGKLLVLSLPIKDRKVLSDLSDFLLSSLSSGVLVLAGQGEDRHPILVNLTKDFQKVLSAGELLKKSIAPLCKGQGGGKASFAQGSISDKSELSKLPGILLSEWKK